MARSNTGAPDSRGVQVDEGGRPITDRGGRLVLRTGKLDPEGTDPLAPVTATGTDSPPATIQAGD